MKKTKVYITTQRAIPLGHQGENEVREIIFQPPAELLEENWTLMHQRQDDDEPYLVPLTVTSDSLIWSITSGDTAQSGTGLAQLICVDANGGALKSITYSTSVSRSIDMSGEVPDPAKPWYADMMARIGKAGTVKSVNQVEPDEKGNVQLDISGGSSTPGQDGYSPTAAVTQTDSGAVITITDKSGTTTATVTNGKDGTPGKDGAAGKDGAPGAAGQDGKTPTIGANGNWYLGDTDTGKPSRGEPGTAGKDGTPGKDGAAGAAGQDGYSPTAVVTQTNGGAVITITDKSGTTTATVTNGKDGAPGKDGTAGKDGAAGADGKTPVKGTDYWTESDKEQIVQDVVERVGSTGGTGTPGQDGYSPTAVVAQTDSGAVITITDKSGTTTATVTNGKDGAPGKDGTPGAAGADGKTPVKGTDYWTEADIAEIKSYVDEAILGGAW